MSKELIEQLRDLANCRHVDFTIGYEAADRIEELERQLNQPVIMSEWQTLVQERDQLREQVKMLRDGRQAKREECAKVCMQQSEASQTGRPGTESGQIGQNDATRIAYDDVGDAPFACDQYADLALDFAGQLRQCSGDFLGKEPWWRNSAAVDPLQSTYLRSLQSSGFSV